jgi:phenylalanine-4-hydroxylase
MTTLLDSPQTSPMVAAPLPDAPSLPLLPDLTAERSAYIAAAEREGRVFIEQPYSLYSPDNHNSWQRLFAAMSPRWEQYGNERFLEGLDKLHLSQNRVPRLEDVDDFLRPLSGFTTQAVSGFVPAALFFECLRLRRFPTTVTIRAAAADFAPWPDIFHDVTGHVPMHTDAAFAAALVRLGECARAAGEVTGGREERAHRVSNRVRALARFFWFTVETGLMRQEDGLRAYGSAMLSSQAEIERALCSERVQREPLRLEWAINQGFLPNHYQPLLFWVDSFDHLYELVERLEGWMRTGRLDDVAPGEPGVTDEDIQGFLDYDRS